MVKVCSFSYPKDSDCSTFFEQYPYELHPFQKWAIEAIVTGNHALVCAPTGSGKTLPGEFSLNYFFSQGKKVIYTAPIKALSNEKFHSFREKYPHLRIGLLTGDIKTNPDADVLIMTTEILLNKLYQIKSTSTSSTASISFDMDIEQELGCVVFDEIHMINDEHRGHVWEQSILMLPRHVQIVGLSATLDDPEKFATWLETKGDSTVTLTKQVYLTKKKDRAVPLVHYTFLTTPSGIFKAIKDKSIQEEIRKATNKPFVVQDEKNVFQEAAFKEMNRIRGMLEKQGIRVKRQHVLNKLSEYLVQQEMLPALCYVFSRKKLEICAEELTTNLLEFDSKVPYTVDRECEQIVRKLPNFEEYLHLPEYTKTVQLLRKGVGIHHAGLMPILREMVEILFARGFIKMLFCTETMSVGINLPVKATIFTDVCKFNGDKVRTLYSHEYTQAAGRAGRLGLDTVGHVIHLNNLFRDGGPNVVSYKAMMSNTPPRLVSKFRISYNLVLNLLDVGETNLAKFAARSMMSEEQEAAQKTLWLKQTALEEQMQQMEMMAWRTPKHVLERVEQLTAERDNMASAKKKKAIDKEMSELQEEYPALRSEYKTYEKLGELRKQYADTERERVQTEGYFVSSVEKVLDVLRERRFLEGLELTLLGRMALPIREVHCLVVAESLDTLATLSAKQLVAVLSCFTSVSVEEMLVEREPVKKDAMVAKVVQEWKEQYDAFEDMEVQRGLNTGIEYGTMHYDMITLVSDWCDCMDVQGCKEILLRAEEDKGIFLGEFVKAMLKINNIVLELEKVAEMTCNIEFLKQLREIPTMTLKYVVTSQSLYV